MMQSEIKIHVDIDNKKVWINGDVSLKAILALLKGLDEDPEEFQIGQIEFVPEYPVVQPSYPIPEPYYPFKPYKAPQFDPFNPYEPPYVVTCTENNIKENEILTHNID